VLSHAKFCKLILGHDLTVGVPGIEDQAFADDQNRINGGVLKDVS